MFHQVPKTNIILVCDDESYKKSLLNSIKNAAKKFDLLNELDGSVFDRNSHEEIDILDFQTNVLTQVNREIGSNLNESVFKFSKLQ